MLDMQILVSLHVLFAGLFLGTNIYLDFIVTPAMSEILPGQAARVSDRLGTRVAWLTLGSLVGLFVTGVLLIYKFGFGKMLLSASFLLTGYGVALSLMIFLWATTMLSGTLMMFYFRPLFLARVPLKTDKETIETARDGGMEAGNRMGLLARYNAVAGLLAVITGGVLRHGGFW